MNTRSLSVAVIAALALSACGGGGSGGGGSLPSTTQPTPTPNAANPNPTVKFTITVPSSTQSSSRTHQYVSPNTGSVQITLESVNGAKPSSPVSVTAAISSNASGCTAAQNGLTCTVPVQAPAGLDLFAITTYQSSNATGTPLASTSVSANAGSTAPTVALSLGGVPAKLVFSPAQLPMANDGAIHRYPVTMNVTDASGAAIVGASAYQSPVSLQILNDPAHALTLSTTVVTQPGTVVTVTYDSSKRLTQGQILATDSAMPSVSLLAAPLNVAPSPIVIADTTTSAALTLSEAGFAGAYSVSVANTNDASVSVAGGPLNSGSAVATIVPKTRFDITSLHVGDGNVSESIPLTIAPQSGPYSKFGNAHSIQPGFSFVKAANGTFWTTDTQTGSVVQFDPSNGTFTSHVVDPGLSGPSSLALDSAGNVWFTDQTQIGEYVVASGTVNTYSTGLSASPNVNQIIAGPPGTMWFYDEGANAGVNMGQPTYFGSIDTTTGTITEYPTNTAAAPILSDMPMVLAPDNSIWFGDGYNAGSGRGSLGHIDTTNGTITETPLGTPGAPQQAPMQFAVTPDGKIWMTSFSPTSGTSLLASIDPHNNNAITYYTQGFTQPGFTWAMTLGSDGNLWFAIDPSQGLFRSSQMLVGVANPNTGAIYEYPGVIVPADAQITGLIDGGNGTFWMLDSGFGQIGKVTFK